MRPDRRKRPADEFRAPSGDFTPSLRPPAVGQRRARRRLTVSLVNRNCAYVSGHGSRELLTQMRGRPPIWSSINRAWVTTERTARDLLAVAEVRGYEVTLEHGDPGEGRW